jgi:hypothetical protein
MCDLALGRGSAADREHADLCPVCADGVETWRNVLADLRQMEAEPVDDTERHRLRTLFRAHAPVRATFAEWLARLVRTTTAAPAAVRGGAAPSLQEHEAGPYHVTLRTARAPGSEVEVHGQVLCDGGPVGSGELLISDADGRVVAGPIDDTGEFSVRAPSGRYRVALVLERGRIVIPALDLGSVETG